MHALPSRTNFFHFHAVFGKNLANDFRPKLRHWCPHLVNPGCATVKNEFPYALSTGDLKIEINLCSRTYNSILTTFIF